jgi:hypothetical protein
VVSRRLFRRWNQIGGTRTKAGIYSSIDSGMTWISNNAPTIGWEAVASSADGSKSIAVRYNGGIWISQTTPTPQLNIFSSSSHLKLSWTVPSANFVLQQNSNLTTTNWSTLPITPTVNLTNLQNEISCCSRIRI